MPPGIIQFAVLLVLGTKNLGHTIHKHTHIYTHSKQHDKTVYLLENKVCRVAKSFATHPRDTAHCASAQYYQYYLYLYFITHAHLVVLQSSGCDWCFGLITCPLISGVSTVDKDKLHLREIFKSFASYTQEQIISFIVTNFTVTGSHSIYQHRYVSTIAIQKGYGICFHIIFN